MSLKKINVQIALYEPEIPQNVGTILRTSACFNMKVLLIEPFGFILADRSLKRAQLDYEPDFKIFSSFQNFMEKNQDNRKILFTPHTGENFYDFNFQNGDILFFGRESNGVEKNIATKMDAMLSFPMSERARSLNLAASVAIGASFIFGKYILKNN